MTPWQEQQAAMLDATSQQHAEQAKRAFLCAQPDPPGHDTAPGVFTRTRIPAKFGRKARLR